MCLLYLVSGVQALTEQVSTDKGCEWCTSAGWAVEDTTHFHCGGRHVSMCANVSV